MSATLLDRLIDPIADCLTVQAAEKIVLLRADPELQKRIDELAEKANRGELTAEEQGEYDRYLAAYHVVTLMQARARRVLNAA
jgi:hypothetical protein